MKPSTPSPAGSKLVVHAYTVVRVKVTGAESISADPATAAEAVAAAVSAGSDQWLHGRHRLGLLPSGDARLRVESVEFAEDIESILVDEVALDSPDQAPIEHLFDHTGASMKEFPGCRTAREGQLKEELAQARADNADLIRAIAACRDLFPMPPPGGPLEREWLAAMADPLCVPELLAAAVKAGLPLSVDEADSSPAEHRPERIRP